MGSAAVKKLMMATTATTATTTTTMAPPPPVLPPKNNTNKRVARGDFSLKENSNSTTTSSCVSGKGSEISLPSSCGTALSQFSDSFMALHLSDHHHELE